MQKAKVKSPNLREEQKLWQKGYDFVVGLDEVGRGPLAGPVVAGAVCLTFSSSPQLRGGLRRGDVEKQKHHLTAAPRHLSSSEERWGLKNIRDSKKLSASQRAKWYEFLTTHPDIKRGIGLVSEKIIDRINILEATKLAMKLALEELARKGVKADYLLLDGNFSIRIALARSAPRGSRNTNARPRLDGESRRAPMRIIPCKSVIKGDEKIWSCAAASIIAKVTRDRLMVKYHKKFPAYGFDRHKGYGTRQHLAALKKHGVCNIHRKSFTPCKKK